MVKESALRYFETILRDEIVEEGEKKNEIREVAEISVKKEWGR